MHGNRRFERDADHVAEVMVFEASSFRKARGVHEQHDAELLAFGEDRPEARGGEILAVDIGRNLDAAEPERFHKPFEFLNSQLGRLERDRPKPDEAIRVTPDDLGDVVVDKSRRRNAEIRLGPIEHLPWCGRDRLHVDAHHVHVGQPLFDRGQLCMHALHLLALHFTRPVVGKPHRRIALWRPERLYQFVGRLEVDMAMNVDREPPAARM